MNSQLPVSETNLSRWIRRCYVVLLFVVGVTLAVGGTMLVTYGGSPYYVLAGLAIVISGLLIWRRDSRGVWLYGAMLAATVAWAISEVGFDGWGLVARLAALIVLGLPGLTRSIRFPSNMSAESRRVRGWPAFAGALIIALLVGAGFHAMGVAPGVDPLLQHGTLAHAPDLLAQPLAAITREDWQHYGNDSGGTRFSPLTQITPQNVDKLKVAWEADTGPAQPDMKVSLEVTPINIGDALYLCNAYNDVISLDAETGHERWRTSMTRDTPPSSKPCRGVSYYRVPEAKGLCAERILAVSQTPELFALDAATGKPCTDFGTEGHVTLKEGMGDLPYGYYSVTSAPQIIRGKAVLGGGIVDGQFWGEPSGVIRAFDAVTGRLAWAFDVGHPENHGVPVPGETYTPSTPNSWAPISADETLGLVYLPMGNSSPDHFGGMRRSFDENVASAVIALDAETGKLRWRFQTVHHDLWDYDVPSQPTLVDLPTPGGLRQALIQTTKQGEIFVLDRATGEPIKAVTELPVPQSGIAAGERLSPTQPYSTDMPALRSARLREAETWGISPVDQMVCRILFKKSRYEGEFTPPTLDRPILFTPGFGGGAEWGGVSVDVDRGIMIVNWNRYASRVELITRAEAEKRGFKSFNGQGQGNSIHPMKNTPYAAKADVTFMSPLHIPCTAPPWGLITAIDLASGRVIWNNTFGTGRDSGPWGIPSHVALPMGVPNIGGPLTTRSGLVFIAATAERSIRAYDVATGHELWQARLPGGGQATPMTYRSAKSGRQFIVIAAGGKPKMSALGTEIVAYALP
jgi:quinoprotein glucose dehydrogenase